VQKGRRKMSGAIRHPQIAAFFAARQKKFFALKREEDEI